jgi:hypothetical protein
MPPNHHVAHVLRLIHYYFPWQTSVNLITEGLTELVEEQRLVCGYASMRDFWCKTRRDRFGTLQATRPAQLYFAGQFRGAA